MIRRTWVIVLLIWGGALLKAQDYPYEVEQFPFINYGQNMVSFPGEASHFEKLYAKMDAMMFEGMGQVQVVHIGGSHIQADMWSDRMRQRLQTFFPGNRSSRGLLFPFKMAKTNNPYNYKTEFTGNWERCRNIERNRDCTLGLTGISVTTTDTLCKIKLSFRGEDYPRYAFSRVRIFHDLANSYEIKVVNPVGNVRDYQSNKLGYTSFHLSQHQTELELEIRKTNSTQDHFTLYGISLESDDPGFVYHAIGVNGAATTSYKRCKLMEQHLQALQPDLVIFSIGINDAAGPNFVPASFERNYAELIRRVRSANPDAAILFTTNNDSYYRRKPNRNAETVRASMLKLAQEYGAGVWDMYGIMGGLGSIRKWELAGLASKDKIHLVKPGYVLVADLMFNALIKSYDDHLRLVGQKERNRN